MVGAIYKIFKISLVFITLELQSHPYDFPFETRSDVGQQIKEDHDLSWYVTLLVKTACLFSLSYCKLIIKKGRELKPGFLLTKQ